MKKVYFLNTDFGIKLTGVERSSLKRAFLFKNHLNITPNFICSSLNLHLNKNVSKYKEIGWMPKDCSVFNIYDSLRGKKEAVLASKNKQFCYTERDFNIVNINSKHQRYIGKINKISMYVVWQDEEKHTVNYINFFCNKKKFRREKYDENGFLYVVQYLDDNAKVIMDDIVDLQGNVILKRYFNPEKNLIKRIELYSETELKNVFETEQEFIAYWLKEFNPEPQSLLVIDKNRFWAKAASQLKGQCKVVSILHSVHVRESDINNIISGKLNSNYADVLESKYPVDAIVTLTETQKDDLALRYGDTHQISVIPHSLDQQQPAPESYEFLNETRNIIAMCRLSSEKQLEDMIQIMAIMKNINSIVKLYIYGEGAERIKLTHLIKTLDLGDTVFLPGFVHNLDQVYKDAALSMLTSKCEGFSLAILESLGYGIPVIAYDIKYGPSSMIKNGENGYLFKDRDFNAIANKINQVLNDDILLNTLKENAYNTSLAYSEAAIAERWKLFLDKLYA